MFFDLALADFFAAFRDDFFALDCFAGDPLALLALFAARRLTGLRAARLFRRSGWLAIGGTSNGSDTKPSATNGM